MSKPKLDLTLIKQLVAELEAYALATDAIDTEDKQSRNDYIVEMAKVMGLTTGIAAEAYLLAGDVQTIVRTTATPMPGGDGNESLKSIFSMFKDGKMPSDN